MGKNFNFSATFGGHLGFLRKMKKCEYLENRMGWSDFEQIFDPQGSIRVSCAKGEKFEFYCVNTSYPMDNCFTGRRDQSRQMPEKTSCI